MIRKSSAALLWIVAIFMANAGPVHASDPARLAEGRHLIQLIGMETLLLQMADGALTQQIEATRATDPDIPDMVLDVVRAELESAYRESFDEMLNWAAGLFTDRMSAAEMSESVAFYASPTGQKILHVTPQIMQESMAIGQRWSEQIMIRVGPKIEARLRKSGFIAPPAGPPPGIPTQLQPVP